MKFIDCFDKLNKNKDVFDLFGLRLVTLANAFYLVDKESDELKSLFNLNVSEAINMTRFISNQSFGCVDFCLSDDYSSFKYTDFEKKVSLVKRKENDKGKVLLEVKKLKKDSNYHSYILISDDSIKFSVNLGTNKVGLNFSENKLCYTEITKNGKFDIGIDSDFSKKITLTASNYPYLAVQFNDKKNNFKLRQKEFLANTHIKEVLNMVIKEMSKYFPNLEGYLKQFEVYNKINNVPLNFLEKTKINSGKNKIENIIYDGMIIKTHKLK